MKVIKLKEVYEDYKDANKTVFRYWQDLSNSEILSKEELSYAKSLTDSIYLSRKTSYKDIDKNFTDIFSLNKKPNTFQISEQMGAEIGGFEHKGLKAFFVNVEMGINIMLKEPKPEDAPVYLEMIEVFNLGLDNPLASKKFMKISRSDNKIKEEIKKVKPQI